MALQKRPDALLLLQLYYGYGYYYSYTSLLVLPLYYRYATRTREVASEEKADARGWGLESFPVPHAVSLNAKSLGKKKYKHSRGGWTLCTWWNVVPVNGSIEEIKRRRVRRSKSALGFLAPLRSLATFSILLRLH